MLYNLGVEYENILFDDFGYLTACDANQELTMRFEQTRTILQHLAPDYHRTVSDYYRVLAEGDVSPRVRMMLDYLIDHEQHRALALGEYCQGCIAARS